MGAGQYTVLLSVSLRGFSNREYWLVLFLSKSNNKDLVILKELIESGKITPVIDRVYPLSDTPEAFRYLEESHAKGKVVITMSG